MQLENRLRKLESRSNVHHRLPEIIFYLAVEPQPGGGGSPAGSYLCSADIIGSGIGTIKPFDGEFDEDFERRVYAIKAGGKMVEDMTDAEREAAYREGDAALAHDETEEAQR